MGYLLYGLCFTVLLTGGLVDGVRGYKIPLDSAD